jgi:hypothetical protein
MRSVTHASIVLLASALAFTLKCHGASTAGSVQFPTRQQLVSGPKGPLIDPFYQADSVGLIVYAESGWMSVQIAAPHRKTWPATTSRSAQESRLDVQLKTAAFDSYYAYFGTWSFDDADSVVTHRVTASLIPAEAGASYTQKVTLDGPLMTLTSVEEIHGVKTVRRKLWQRVEAN